MQRLRSKFASVCFFLERYSRENGFAVPELTPEILRELHACEWPGNIRELENIVERLVVLSKGGPVPPGIFRLDRPRFPCRGRSETVPGDLLGLIQRAVRRAVEVEAEAGSLYHFTQLAARELLNYVLTLSDGVKTKAAKLLGNNRNTLAKKLGETAVAEKDQDWMI